MIAHMSVPARNPAQTARLLARLIGGTPFPFPVVPGGCIAVSNDGSGLAIEVLPETMAHRQGSGDEGPANPAAGPATMPWEVQIRPDGDRPRPGAVHMALVSPLSETDVIGIGREAGWRALGCERGGVFRVVELWVDNTFLIEVLTEKEAVRYRSFMQPKGCAEMFGPPLEQAA